MLSIIICSRNPELLESFSKNIHDTVGCEYELITIDNSHNEHSIFSAYNSGIERSKFSNLCFVHEDVQFVTPNWGEKIIKHLAVLNVGLIGVAGGQAMLRVPLGWPSLNAFYNVIHSTKSTWNVIVDNQMVFPTSVDCTALPVVLLDGVFLCAKKELFNHIKFDESFAGFHGYDLDISVQAIQKGYSNYVIYDVDLRHFSKGNFGVSYIEALLKIDEKWSAFLPVFEQSFTDKMKAEVLYKAEKSALLRFRKMLIRAGMVNAEIYQILRKFILLSGNKLDKFLLFTLPISLTFIRLTSIVRGKMLYQVQNK